MNARSSRSAHRGPRGRRDLASCVRETPFRRTAILVNRTVAGLSAALSLIALSACSGLPTMWGDAEPVPVTVEQIGAAPDCRAGDRIRVFPAADTLRAWADGRGLQALVGDAQPGRPHAVIALGSEAGPVSGFAIARDALRRGGTLELQASVFGSSESAAAASPCVLVALPGPVDGDTRVRVLDSTGRLVAATPD